MAWHLIKSGGDGEEFGFAHKEFLIDNESDLSTEPATYGPIAIGSKAHLAGFQKEFEKGANGIWEHVVGGAGVSIHICSSDEYDHETYIPTVSDPEDGTIYFVPDGTGDDLFVEWIYINNAWEKFGSARIDLSGYITGVTVNGTSVVNNGVAAIPKATSSAFGVVSPATKTTSMATAVGVDADGRLWASSDESKADQNGSYPQMTVGTAEQIATTLGTEDNDPYTIRKAGGTANVGKSEKDKIVGCSLAWNQMVAISSTSKTTTTSGVTYTDNRDGTYSVQTDSAGATAATGFTIGTYALMRGHIYYLCGAPSGSTSDTYYLYSTQTGAELGNGLIVQSSNNANATLTIPVKSGTIITTPVKFVPQLFDLTQMFGHNIATYIKSLETATSGAGVAWFRKLFPKAYYTASNDTLQHVRTTAHKTIGFNQFDELWENKVLNSDGTVSSNSSRRTFTNYMRVFPNTTYCMRIPYSGTGRGAFYDESQNLISYYSTFPVSGNTAVFPNGTTTTPTGDGSYYFLFITPSNAQYFKYSTPGTNNANICVNFHRNGERDGEYEPYDEHVYPLAADVSLRGVPLLDANNNLYYSGDSYESNGTVTRRYGLLNLGSISSWARITDNSTGISYYRCTYSAAKGAANTALANAITPKHRTVPYSGSVSIFNTNKTICITSSNKYICIRDDSYTTVAALKTALAGIYLVYELATPTTETADTYTNPQIVNKFGTEEYVDTRDVPIPVGHETVYPVDLVEKLETAPDTPSANGDYILRHANNTNSYVELSDAATVTDVRVNGTSVVTNGVAAIPKASSSVFGVVNPDAKTSAMTQAVGVDSNGKLYTEPGSGGGSSDIHFVDFTYNSSTKQIATTDTISNIWSQVATSGKQAIARFTTDTWGPDDRNGKERVPLFTIYFIPNGWYDYIVEFVNDRWRIVGEHSWSTDTDSWKIAFTSQNIKSESIAYYVEEISGPEDDIYQGDLFVLNGKLYVATHTIDGYTKNIVVGTDCEATTIANEFIRKPAYPEEDGTYHLKLVVDGGEPTLSWEADS